MPSQAFGLKKYRGRPGEVGGSKMSPSDDEHSSPSLGNSEVLSVQHSVGPPIPEVCQRPDDGAHVPSVV
jgi:hypothetical protein